MKNSFYLLAVLALVGTVTLDFGSATAQVLSPPSASDIARAKNAATIAAGQSQGTAPTFASDGSILRDNKGDVVTQSNSANALKDSMGAFKKMTGLGDIEQVRAPGNSTQGGLANFSVTKSIDFQCTTSNTSSRYSGGQVVFQILGCNLNSVGAGTVSMKMCDSPATGGTCSSDSDFGAAFDLSANQYTQKGDISLGLGCNGSKACRITLSGNYAVGGSDASMKQAVQSASTNNSLVGQLRTSVNDGSYAGQMDQSASLSQACAKAAMNGQNVPENCPGATTPAAVESGKCSGAKICLKTATSTQNFTRSCTRTFPLTEKLTHSQLTAYSTCTIAEVFVPGVPPLDPKLPTPAGTWSLSTSCTQPTTGMTKLDAGTRLCSKNDVKDGSCIEYKTMEAWANPSVSSVTSVSASPSAITGACDTNPASETRHTSCENGNWFGRSLPLDQCVSQFFNEATGTASGAVFDLDYLKKPGCGVCLTPVVGETCYGASQVRDETDSCGDMDLAGCTLTKTTPRNYTGNGGLISSQEETYSCSKQSNTCVQWSEGEGDSTCSSSSSTFGLDQLKQDSPVADGALNKALVAAAILDSTAEGVEGQQLQATPKIFTGTEMRCTRATGGIGQLVGRNCCRTDIERPIGAQLTRAGCNMDEAKLSAARRSSYATYIGDYCSSKLNLLFTTRCLERTETYCVFPGILPRIVQEQGRQQLSTMTASSGTPEKKSVTFNYYDSGNGTWSNAFVANNVTTHAWQWPSYCADSKSAADKLLNDPTAKDCAGIITSWFATCDNPQGCGALPQQPSEGSSQWQLTALNPLENITTATSHYSVVTGACSTQSQQCSYTLSAWPAGIGGKAVSTRDLTWNLFANDAISDSNTASAMYQINNIGDFMFKGIPTPGLKGNSLPPTVKLEYSRNGGQSWQSVNLATNAPTTEMSLDGDIKLIGNCDLTTNMCNFRASGTTTVTVKPWGSAESPDCSGFTPGQLSMLDFGKMDLSEWLSSVMSKVNSQNPAQLASTASSQVASFNAAFNQGTVSQTKPSAATFARAVPSEGFGPFNAKLVVSGVWPEVTGDPSADKDLVTSVEVDWDDCTVPQTIQRVPSGQGTGFSATHQFKAPDTMTCKGGNIKQNITHKVKITAYTTLSGKQVRTVSVENAWSKFPGGKGNNDNINGVIKVTVPSNGGPSSKVPPNQ